MTKPIISPDVVRHVAKLAALELEPAEQERMRSELESILGLMSALDEVVTANVPPTFHAMEMSVALRDDEVKPSLSREVLLAQAPASDAGAFCVPRVLEGES